MNPKNFEEIYVREGDLNQLATSLNQGSSKY